MSLYCLGISHHRASLSLREQIAFSKAEVQDFYKRKSIFPANMRPKEHALLSTCNRTEYYVLMSNKKHISDENMRKMLLKSLLEHKSELNYETLEESAFFLKNAQVPRHLFEVACGLDSMVLGENEILGQVIFAYEQARENRSIQRVLSECFSRAIRSGKRARSETQINQHRVSLSTIALDVLKKHHHDLEAKNVLIIGTGKMSRLTLDMINKLNPKTVKVVSRDPDGAAKRLKVSDSALQIVPISKLAKEIVNADIIFTATNAKKPLLLKEHVMNDRREKLVVDLAVPRNVDESIRTLIGVTLYNLDDLKTEIQLAMEQRHVAIPKVEEIIFEEIQSYREWAKTSQVLPTIRQLHERAGDIKEKVRNELGLSSPAEAEVVDRFFKRYMSQWLKKPAIKLREAAHVGQHEVYLDLLNDIFQLDGMESWIDPETVSDSNEKSMLNLSPEE